jgi:pilus assembly protein CpaF
MRELVERLRSEHPLLDTASVGARAADQWRRSHGLGSLEALLHDPEIGEIMINGAGPVWIDRGLRAEPSGLTIDEHDLGLVMERILDPLGLRVDPSSPVADARLDDGSRVNIVVPPLAVDGPIVTIRRFTDRPLPLTAFGGPGLEVELRRLVADRQTVLVVGATSSGKTTLLNALGALLDPDERVVTIEDTAELRLPGAHVVRLEARDANSEGVGAVTLRDLVRNALRMRPDRLIVGEVRGPEALDLILGLNTGHRGSMTTCHAGSPGAGLERLVALGALGAAGIPVPALAAQVGTAIDAVVLVERCGSRRLVREIATVGHGPELTVETRWRAASGLGS